MNDLYTNMDRETKILRHAARNNCEVVGQLCTERCVMFTVPEKQLPIMKKFCKENFGSCEVVEQVGSVVMCRVD